MPGPKIKLGEDVRAAINKIHEENEALKQDLARESRQARLTQVMNSSQGGVVQRLQAEADLFLRRIDGERRKIATLDKKIAEYSRAAPESRLAAASRDDDDARSGERSRRRSAGVRDDDARRLAGARSKSSTSARKWAALTPRKRTTT